MPKTAEQVRQEWFDLGAAKATRMRELEVLGFDARTERQGRELRFLRDEFWRHFDRRADDDWAWMDGFYSVYGLQVSKAG